MRFHRWTIRLILAVAGGLLLAQVPAGAATQNGGGDDQTVLDGVYTADQANRGAQAFDNYCFHCHGEDPEMPALYGRNFIDRWREDGLDVLYNHIATRMPADGRRLDEKTYVDLTAYLLRENGYRTGREALDAATMDAILLVGHDGPQPLPNNSIVRLVGCLAEEEGDWVLTHSTAPARTKDGREMTEDELARAGRIRLGTRRFPLQNFMNIYIGYDPSPMKGHRVLAKGVLLRRGEGERINMTALESVAETCEP